MAPAVDSGGIGHATRDSLIALAVDCRVDCNAPNQDTLVALLFMVVPLAMPPDEMICCAGTTRKEIEAVNPARASNPPIVVLMALPPAETICSPLT